MVDRDPGDLPDPADEQAPSGQDDPAAAQAPGDEDEQHRKFRAALDRKNAHHTAMHAEGNRNQGVRQARNDKQQREFRRKSG